MFEVAKTIQDISNSPAVESLATASISAMNPLARAYLTGVHAAIQPTREQGIFLDKLLTGFSTDTQTASERVFAAALDAFSALFNLSDEGSASQAIVDQCRKRVGVTKL